MSSALPSQPPVNLFLQALTTFDVPHHVISRPTTFFSQRKPYELGSFSWIVDGKDPFPVYPCQQTSLD
jgi:hypothetical protein